MQARKQQKTKAESSLLNYAECCRYFINERIKQQKTDMIYHLNNIDSTSTELRRRMSADELPHGYCISADFQTNGHGQATNHWESADGKNLLFSLLLRPTVIPASEQFIITELVTLAIINVLQDEIREKITIKWCLF